MKNILTCADGSLHATSLYQHTAWAALRTGAAVHVLHLLDAHRERAATADISGHMAPDTGEALLEEYVSTEEAKNRLAREHGRLLLADAARHLAQAGVPDVTTSQQHGSPEQDIPAIPTDLLILGRHGEHPADDRHPLGRHLEPILRQSTRPVLVTARTYRPIEKFLVAYDASPGCEKAIRFLIETPLLHGLECHILRARAATSEPDHQLVEATAKLTAAGFSTTAHHLEGPAETAIPALLERENIPLLVMGAYSHSRLREFLLGSTTTTLLRTCPVTTLLMR